MKPKECFKDILEFLRKRLSLTVKRAFLALEESGFFERPTSTSPSRKSNPHRCGYPTHSPRRRHRKEEKDHYLHTDKI
jgi:hypothetical protein